MNKTLVSCCIVLAIAMLSKGAPMNDQLKFAINQIEKEMITLMNDGDLSDILSTLYTPQNAEHKCKKTALQCFTVELRKLKEEHTLLHSNAAFAQEAENLLKMTDVIAARMNATNTEEGECKKCEDYPEKKAKMFLEEMQRFMQCLYKTS
nr:PREDICTED: interleukin-15-like [Latimeria chalumnae]|eukprot:XP_006012207.1 PREDICTED: interleukin-15-like [Latimeria chalumnae]